MSLRTLLTEQAILLNDIAESEINEEQAIQLAELDMAIPEKVDAWAMFLKSGGNLDIMIGQLKDRISEIKKDVDRLEIYKQNRQMYLHNLIEGDTAEGLEGLDFMIKKDFSVTSEVNLSEVEPQYKKYIVEMDYKQFETFDLMNMGDVSYKEKCGVTMLPPDHKAINKMIRPTIKVLKAKRRK